MAVRAEPTSSSGQREWWLRAVLVLQAPRAVFSALRDQSQEAVDDRQEPVTALIFLAGIAGVLATPTFGKLMEDPVVDALLVAVLAVFAGAVYGFFAYWVLGWALSRGIGILEGTSPAHLCRHVLAYSTAPLVLSLALVWPVRLALYGTDLFKQGGSDGSATGQVLRWACVAAGAWSVGLLVTGVRTIEHWPWWRALAAAVFAVALTALALAVWALLA